MSAELIDNYFRAVNTENWELMAQVWNETGELVAVGVTPRVGRDRILEYFPRILAGYAEHVDTPSRIVTAGDTVLVEIDFVGRLRSGSPITFNAIDVFDLVDGRIQRLSTWYDSYSVFKMVAEATAARSSESVN
jgi:ketosteroid isomerase-like protein